MWHKTGPRSWTVDHGSLEGEAKVIEVEGGYKAVLDVTDADFDMTFASEEEFFQSESEALSFLREAMEDAV